MARSPLFRLVRHALRLADLSTRSGIPVDELIERARAERLTRRAFLRGAATAAAALPLSGGLVGRALAAPGGAEVAIVGGGIAGLTAAWRLREAGIPCRIFEAQNRSGGRMFSLRGHFAGGQSCELGGELIDTGHARIRALAEELGLLLDDLSVEEPDIRVETFHFGGQLRSEAEIVAAFGPVAERIRADMEPVSDDDLGAGGQGRARELDLLSVRGWFDRAGVSGWLRSLLDVGYTTEFGLETDEQSALNLLTMIGTEPDSFRIFGESDERFRVKGGNDWIVRGLAERLADSITLNSRLEALRTGPDGRFVLSLRGAGGSREVHATHVVLALPFTLLRQVRLDLELPPPKRLAIDTLGYGTNAKLMIGYSERVWRRRHGAGGSLLTDRPLQLAWETSRAQPGAEGILTNFTGGRHGVEIGQGSAAAQAEQFTRDLEPIFPGVTAARSGMTETRFHWPSFPWTLGSYASYRVGQWTTIGGLEGAPVGRLYFAGEHCSVEAQGFMEGGCETGEAAAAAIRQDLGR